MCERINILLNFEFEINQRYRYSTFASSAPSSATRKIIEEFGIPDEVSYLVTTVFLLGYVFGVRRKWCGFLVFTYFVELYYSHCSGDPGVKL